MEKKDEDISNLRFMGFVILICFFCVIMCIFGFTFARQGQLPTIDELIIYSVFGMFVGLILIFIDELMNILEKRKRKKNESEN